LFQVFHENTESHDVGELFEADILTLHLTPDRIGPLLPTGDFCVQPPVAKLGQKRLTNPVHNIAAGLCQEIQPGDDRGARIGIEFLKGDVLQFLLPIANTDPLCQRDVDIHRLAGDTATLLGRLDEMKRPHIVKPVRKLDDEDADILRHRKHKLLKILRLFGTVGLQF